MTKHYVSVNDLLIVKNEFNKSFIDAIEQLSKKDPDTITGLEYRIVFLNQLNPKELIRPIKHEFKPFRNDNEYVFYKVKAFQLAVNICKTPDWKTVFAMRFTKYEIKLLFKI